ncbi:hypothetical protein [Reticulibacter mediterranei]|uniref:hypothetical protein n=1 Tax=Reticulibacter mediterranei TaxID=2778369 RepID=UPI001F272D24|nr:hypothetical protein [Reticulibacter mediterranei]
MNHISTLVGRPAPAALTMHSTGHVGTGALIVPLIALLLFVIERRTLTPRGHHSAYRVSDQLCVRMGGQRGVCQKCGVDRRADGLVTGLDPLSNLISRAIDEVNQQAVISDDALAQLNAS